MTALAHRVVRQHGFLVALASAAVVFGVLVLQGVLGFLLSQLGALGTGPTQGFAWWAFYGAFYLPFSIGVLLSLWFIAPIGPQLHIAHVITRSLLASASGAVLVFFVLMVITSVSITSGFMSQLRFAGVDTDSILNALGNSANTAGQQFLAATPLVILVGVLLRMWLGRHPSEHDIAGIVDTA